MNKKQIYKEFDEKFRHKVKNPYPAEIDFGKYILFNNGKIEQINVGELSLDIKHFIHQQIEKVIDELVGEEDDLKNAYTDRAKWLTHGYNNKRQEIIKKAQEMGYYK